MVVSMAVVPAKAAVIANNGTDYTADLTPTVKATNSFGALIADQFQSSMDAQSEKEQLQYVITNVDVEGNTASVSYVAEETCNILVALYDEDTGEMLASGNSEAAAAEEETLLDITIDTESMPQYFVLKAFMLDNENNPLNDYYITGFYSQAIQKVDQMQADDFDSERVLNLDDDNETNFAVYGNGVKVIPYTEGFNIPNTTYSEKGVYVFSNANDDIKTLKKGDVISYTYKNDIILINVEKISVDGDTVTVTDNINADTEVFFEYIKIDSQSTEDDMEYDGSTADEGVIFEGIGEDENDKTPYPSGANTTSKLAVDLINLNFKILDKSILEFDDKEPEDDIVNDIKNRI